MRLSTLRQALALAIAISVGAIAAAAPTGAATQMTSPDPGILDGGCGAWLDNPHYSSGAGGVIVKTRYFCDIGFAMTVNGALSYLYFCPAKPSGSRESEWTNSGQCAPVRSSNYPTFYVGPNQTVTKYTPPVGQSGATYKGWYIACTRYNRADIGDVRVWSLPAYVTW